MASSSYLRLLPLASLNNSHNSSKSTTTDYNNPPTIPKLQTPTIQNLNNNNNKPMKKKQRSAHPSVVDIERAIGAGSYRDDGDPNPIDTEQMESLFEGLLPLSTGKFEGPVEKKLRETGEWIAHETESKFLTSGRGILLGMMLWILPVWTFSLLVACGIVKLPFSSPLLDELLM